MHRGFARRAVQRLMAVIASGLLAAAIGPSPAAAVVYEFPPGNTGYHTYAEVAAEVAAAAAAYPRIVHRFSIGQSHQGRALWAVKVSDNVDVDEGEPEVLFEGGHHGDEHMGTEMTLAILRWLTTGYGSDARVTRLVDYREIWIVFLVNPDGATHNIANRVYQDWRKNRQPTPGSTFLGTDLNRNYDYHWGCCGGSSATPSNSRFRGPAPFSAPETRAIRDFVASRVVGGRQQIRAAIGFHTTGRLVLYPYGWTTVPVPKDMTTDDRAALVALAKMMAASNGYKAMQASSLYGLSGSSSDWLYGRHRIFAFVIELEPSTALYQPDEQIGPETSRNREAVLDLLGQADCPWRLAGRYVTHCGAFFDDVEIARGWTRDPDGTDTATAGVWALGDPGPTTSNGPKQLDATTSGYKAFVTGNLGGSATANDLDGGTTTLRSTPIRLPDVPGQRLTFRYSFAHGADSEVADELRVLVERSNGSTATVFLERGAANDDDAAWATASYLLDAWAGETIRIRLLARDTGRASLVEAMVDDIRVTRG
jgi:hypothetical protein